MSSLMRPLFLITALTLAAGLSGCTSVPANQVDATTFAASPPATTATAGGATSTATTPSRIQTAAGTGASTGSVSLDPTTTAANPRDDYRIQPLDLIQVDVFQVPDLSKTVQVSGNGLISLPLIGQVMAGGKTTHELETAVAAALGAKYLQSPEVSVSIKDAVSQRITVEGAVQRPGIFPTAGQTSLMQVIALSGGLNEIADDKAVIVFRNVGGKRQAAVFDYQAIRTGHVDDPTLRGGDIVAVDESGSKAAWRNLRQSVGVANLFVPLAGL